MHRRRFLTFALAGIGGTSAGCVGGDGADGGMTVETLTLTTTTSTYDTGLLAELNAAFTERFGLDVNAVAQGTGAALQTARQGDADVVMVYARSLEDDFLRDGYGINRLDLMMNDFVVVGPSEDPAGIGGLDAVTEAFAVLADAEATFISRGDNSGTHNKEREIWAAAGIDPAGDWYREAGSGMGEVLTQADLTPGYTLADRATYVSQRGALDLSIHVQGPLTDGPALLANPYGVIAVNPGRHDHVNYEGAMAYIGFLTAPRGQELIANFTIDGEQVFVPTALDDDPSFDQYVPRSWVPAA